MTLLPPFAAFAPAIRAPSPLRRAITAACRREEADALAPLIDAAMLPAATRAAIADTARALGWR
jgi:RHH-type proline utilization regulon transcriptional repressor/proline dehydrogenase/delta 1-pyrroline-5-carboxylate dehydrogenase